MEKEYERERNIIGQIIAEETGTFVKWNNRPEKSKEFFRRVADQRWFR
jgi:hypothetical protein